MPGNKIKHRPQKNFRQGKVHGKGRQRANQPKTRKELRKEKRQQKKINRFNYHNRSRTERFGNGADESYGGKKNHGKFGQTKDDSGDEIEDEEIESDFSDEEESAAKPAAKRVVSQMDVEREKEMMELRDYEDGIKEKRIEQLEAANEEDDRLIKKYEKLLKIDRGKSKQGVAKSFNDGLDYALELCTEENVRKMYEAAKEAAELEENSSDEFAEDLQQAVGSVVDNVVETENGLDEDEAPRKKTLSSKERKKVEKLKKIEEKYFGLDDIDDLGDYDSEMEQEQVEGVEDDDDEDVDDDSQSDESYDSDREDIEESEEDVVEPNSKKRKVTFADDVKPSKRESKKKQMLGDSKNMDEDSSDGESEDITEKQMKKGKKKKNIKQTSLEDEEDNAPGRFVLLKPKVAKKAKNGGKIEKANGEKNNSRNQTMSDDEEDFDSDVFGGDTDEDEENDGLDDLLNGSDSDEPAVKKVSKETATGDGTWEDIYGRKRDKAGNVIKENTAPATGGGKYVPPHLRAKLEAEAAAKAGTVDPKRQEKLMRLKRQLKGQVNRLAESNVHRISIDLDNLYMQNARYDMNSTLATLILEAIVVPTLTPDRMVLEHVLLVAILHANVGSEVGSHFLETIVERFLVLAKDIETMANEDKQLDNCIQILCHMYSFEIVKCKLVHDILQRLVECFNEKSVECILLVLRSIGFILRKDDPLALKEMIVTIQKKAANAPEALKNDTRVKFMLETLLAVKNNNMNKIPQYDPTLVEHFRKLLKGMIANGKYVSTLNVGLQDIIDIPRRGKWWLVGSAWYGNKDGPPGAGGQQTASGPPPTNGAGGQFSQQLLELARQQRMNTDDRRNVFCVIMSAEDYLDAFEKLLRLAIKDLRVVATVTMHCCLAEKEYNPYYGVLAQKFCDYDRRYQLAIQFALWDRLKEIHSLQQQQQIRNLARFITHLVAEGGLAISCLKVIDFAGIDKVSLRLMRQIMLGLLLLEEENKCLQVFSRITASFKLKSFKDSLRLFMHHFLARGSKSSAQLPEEQVLLLQNRIKQADQLLGSEDTRFVFEDD